MALLAAAAVAATVSAAPDARAPRIVSAAMQDADGDSRADRLRIVYSELIRHAADKDGRYPFQVAGYKIRSVGSAKQKTIVLTLAEKQAADGAARPSIAYRRTKSKAVKDRAGNQARGQVFRAVRAHGKQPGGTSTPPPPPPPPARDSDGDGVIDAKDCAPQNPVIRPGAADAPDLAFVDSNCDGIDGDEQKAIFASPLGKDTNPGTKAAPKREIQAAATVADAAGKHVYAAAGEYGRVVLISRVNIYGGYGPENWTRLPGLATSITGSPEGVYGDKAANVVLQLLTVRGRAVGEPGASAYGLRLVHESKVTLERVTVIAGDAATGAFGATGDAGFPGFEGGVGGSGSCDSSGGGLGGLPGRSAVAEGGAGGRGGYDGRGDDGAHVPGAHGGPGGSSGNPGGDGTDGNPGHNGGPGSNGGGGTSSTQHAAAFWIGEPGSGGTQGGPGTAGGGGGGGGGQTGIFVNNGRGNGGGGGGGAGEGGGGGVGGGPGGGSFGVYLHDSTLSVSGSSAIDAGNGGAGGKGGDGGLGGRGGPGGWGNKFCFEEIGEGGFGGRGGAGGRGGGAGGGAGGPSVGIFKAGGSTATVTNSTVAIAVPAAGGAGGAGGSGSGAPGATGIAQQIHP